MTSPDVIVVGAGIVGAACALEAARAGLAVKVIDRAPPGGGTTAAGMGHITVMDDSEAQLALTRYSQTLWDERVAEMPPQLEHDPAGTLWVATDDEEMDAVRSKHDWYGARDVPTEILDAAALREAEPELRDDLVGALHVPGDGVVYPPAAAAWFLARAVDLGAVLEIGRGALATGDGTVTTIDEVVHEAHHVIVAAGNASLGLLPEIPHGVAIRPRKGHLAITDRRPGFLRHQVVELGYLKSAHEHASSSVAFNVQPRRTGQVLLGSSRQYDREDAVVEGDVLARMIRRGQEYLPRLGELTVIRTWTGFRGATDDALPFIGPVPGRERLLLAAGHEGLGITTSLGTGRLLTDHILGRESAIDRAAYAVDRERAHG